MNKQTKISDFIDRIISNTHTDWHELEQYLDTYPKNDLEKYYNYKSKFYRVYTAYRILQQDLTILRNELGAV